MWHEGLHVDQKNNHRKKNKNMKIKNKNNKKKKKAKRKCYCKGIISTPISHCGVG